MWPQCEAIVWCRGNSNVVSGAPVGSSQKRRCSVWVGRLSSTMVVGSGQCRRSSRGRVMVAMAAIGRWWCWVTKGDWPGRLLGARSIRQSRVGSGSTGDGRRVLRCRSRRDDGRDELQVGVDGRWWLAGGLGPDGEWWMSRSTAGRDSTRTGDGTEGGLWMDGRRLWVSQERRASGISGLLLVCRFEMHAEIHPVPRNFGPAIPALVPVIFSRVQEWL